jgi:hypothetical protein
MFDGINGSLIKGYSDVSIYKKSLEAQLCFFIPNLHKESHLWLLRVPTRYATPARSKALNLSPFLHTFEKKKKEKGILNAGDT